jgi:integrase
MQEDEGRQCQNRRNRPLPAAPGVRRGFEAVVPNPKLKLMDPVREVLRLKHYAIRTETCYCDWIRRYFRFHQTKVREELLPGTEKVEVFLSDLAVNGHVAASTQNQAFNALLFLYREVLHEEFENVQAVRVDRPVRVPVVLTPAEVKQVVVAMSGTTQLVVKLLYGSGLRLLEALRLRVQDLDFAMKQLTVRYGKGAKDRYTVLAEGVIPALREHLEHVRLRQAECRSGAAHSTGNRRHPIANLPPRLKGWCGWRHVGGRGNCLVLGHAAGVSGACGNWGLRCFG